jgi:hypothetical protein
MRGLIVLLAALGAVVVPSYACANAADSVHGGSRSLKLPVGGREDSPGRTAWFYDAQFTVPEPASLLGLRKKR